uniref:Uncharacterized protein n=1 Tax=Picea sitchensis TaxID=3332 RepID=A9NWX0_PICSI|nr:unknown [Picea sitchensis]
MRFITSFVILMRLWWLLQSCHINISVIVSFLTKLLISLMRLVLEYAFAMHSFLKKPENLTKNSDRLQKKRMNLFEARTLKRLESYVIVRWNLRHKFQL